jgi:serine phosphatase RsbU (regulator of sigma subunit)
LCCYTDGLVERRGQVLDQGMNALTEILAKLAAAGPADTPERNAEDACAEVMRALVGNNPPHDDIAVLTLSCP